MREIKFRYWTGDQLVQVHRLTFNDDEFIVEGEGVVHFANAGSLLQFTGLHDKNGREIYECDIVHVWDNGVAVVIFDGSLGCGQWMCKFMPAFPDFEEWSAPLYGWIDGNVDGSVFEILGNIYETPELLEASK